MSITRLSEHRARREHARAIHPSVWAPPMPVVRVWGPGDAIATAQDFHAWADQSEYGTLEPARPDAPWYVGQSRARKARWANRFAVALLMAASVFIGAVVYAASAKADGAVDAWEVEYGPAACSFLGDGHASINGLAGVILGAEEMGLTPEQAGQAVASSVIDICPRYTPLLRQFVARYGPRGVTA